METLEELKAIIENAPEGAKYQALSEARKFYFDSVPDVDGCDMWIVSESGDAEKTDMDSVCICGFDEFRSLSDIKRIIELMESNSKLQNKSGESFKAELLEATGAIMHPHIEGVYAVWENQL